MLHIFARGVASQAFKGVLPVEDSFSIWEMRTFSRIGAHQSTSETFNASLWKKTKPASINYFATVVLAHIRCVIHFRDKFLSFLLWNIMF